MGRLPVDTAVRRAGRRLVALFHELLGDPAGLDGGRGGHMHLLSPEHLAASTGIVGAPLPVACGFGLAAQQAGAGRVCVALFGDGAVNEGMAMESLNLAAVWRLPVVFVCKDNRWAVTTRSRRDRRRTRRRARGFGMPVTRVDGPDVLAVWRASGRRWPGPARAGPTFLIAAWNVSRGTSSATRWSGSPPTSCLRRRGGPLLRGLAGCRRGDRAALARGLTRTIGPAG